MVKLDQLNKVLNWLTKRLLTTCYDNEVSGHENDYNSLDKLCIVTPRL